MYEYLTIETRGNIDEARQALDKYPRERWRLVQLYLTDGYTTGLIFERPIGTAHGATQPADPYHPRSDAP
jgi:hypothetical protein